MHGPTPEFFDPDFVTYPALPASRDPVSRSPARDPVLRSPASRTPRADMACVLVVGVGMAVLYALAYKAHPYHPHIGGNPGWWVWFDQERYLRAAQAWAAGDLNPDRHWYLPGYPLLAAPFVRLLSVHAFFAVNLACLLVSLRLFSRLAARLAPDVAHAPVIGAVLFAATTVLSPLGLNVWVVPWSTSGAVPLFYACLLGATGFVAQPRRANQAFLAGLCGCLVVAFRPSDTLPLLAASGLGMAAALLAQRPGWTVARRGIAAGAAGAATAALLMALAYLPLYGLTRSPYVLMSAAIGFDWGLLPLRWVSIVLSPQPLLSDGQGLIEAFPWIAAGMAGLAAFLLLPLKGAPRLVHVTVIAAVILHAVIYLAYRDLNPGGLFRFWNYHYFKWMYPVLALYAALLAHALLTMPRWRAAIAAVGVATLAALLPWRTQLRVTGPVVSTGVAAADNQLAFVSSMASVRDAVLVPASGEWGTIYLDPSTLAVGGGSFSLGDIKPVPRTGGFLLTPMRPLPTGPALLSMTAGVRIDHGLPALAARQDIVFGIPCWLPAALHTCRPQLFFPPPLLPDGGQVTFDGHEAAFLAGGWSSNEGTGRWTDGRTAELRFRMPPAAHGYTLTLSAYAYLPDRAPPLQLQILANGQVILDEAISQVPLLSLTGQTPAIPAGAIPADAGNGAIPADAGNGNAELTLTLRFGNPRPPKDYDSSSADTRRLGLFVRALTLVPRA